MKGGRVWIVHWKCPAPTTVPTVVNVLMANVSVISATMALIVPWVVI